MESPIAQAARLSVLAVIENEYVLGRIQNLNCFKPPLQTNIDFQTLFQIDFSKHLYLQQWDIANRTIAHLISA